MHISPGGGRLQEKLGQNDQFDTDLDTKEDQIMLFKCKPVALVRFFHEIEANATKKNIFIKYRP